MTPRRRARRGRAARTSPLRSVERIIPRDARRLDVYHRLLTLPWSRTFALLVFVYVAFNLGFAALYRLQDGSIANARPGSFADAFFFSVQTMATIGYGDMHPATFYANLLVTAEVFLGLTGFAVATGLLFARFSRPTARMMFSKVGVIAPYDGVPTLMIRAANQRLNLILEARVSLSLLRDEVSGEGVTMRRFHELRVARSRTPMFALSWTVMHPIDAASPLFGETRESLIRQNAEIVVSITGMDETFAQPVNGRHVYPAAELRWNHRFADILGQAADGRPSIDYRAFHDTVAIAEPAARAVGR